MNNNVWYKVSWYEVDDDPAEWNYMNEGFETKSGAMECIKNITNQDSVKDIKLFICTQEEIVLD